MKKPKKQTPPPPRMRLEVGTRLAGRVLIVDTQGIAWWVDCDSQTIHRAN